VSNNPLLEHFFRNQAIMEGKGTVVSPLTPSEEPESFSAEDLGDRDTDWDGSGWKPLNPRERELYDRLEVDHRTSRVRKHYAQWEVSGAVSSRASTVIADKFYSSLQLKSGNWLYTVENGFATRLFKRINQQEVLQ
jgi:hypothetical protein